MARIRPTQDTEDWTDDRPAGSRKALRYAVPVAVVGVAAATIGLVPALAASGGDPDLPKISAQELITKIAKSDTQRMSGTVNISTDLGIPGLSGADAFGLTGGAAEKDGDADPGAAAPQARLTELAAGKHTVRVAMDGADKQRYSIIEKTSEYSVIHNGDEVWAYDSASNTAYHSQLPEDRGERASGDVASELPSEVANTTPQEAASKALDAVRDSTSVSVDGTSKVAGRDAYRLVIKPEQKSSTVGAVRIAVDADNGVPLKFTLSPRSGGPAIDVSYRSVDFGKPKAGTFDFTPAKGTKVTEAKDLAERNGQGDLPTLDGLDGLDVIGHDWGAVARMDLPGKLTDGAGDDRTGAASDLLSRLGDQVKGDFGSATVFHTRLVNALLTEDGRIYVGAVDQDALTAAANADSE